MNPNYINPLNSGGNPIGFSSNPNTGYNNTNGQVYRSNYLTRMCNMNSNGNQMGGNNQSNNNGEPLNFNIRSTMMSNGGADTLKILWERYNKTLGIHIFKYSSANEALMLCYQDGTVNYIFKKEAGSTDIPIVNPCCICKNLQKFILEDPRRKSYHPYYYKHTQGRGSKLHYPVLDRGFYLGLIMGIWKEDFDKVYLPQLELRNIIAGKFELQLGMDTYISTPHEYEDYRKSSGNSKTAKRFNTRMVNKFLMDNCPDFRAKMGSHEITNYAQYLRKKIMRDSEMVADLHGITRQQLVDLINYRSSSHSTPQEYEDSEARANSIIRQVVSRTDSRVTQFSDIMAEFGFTGQDNLDLGLLSSPQAIETTLEIIQSMRNCLQNSGLDSTDINLLKIELKNMILNALNH